MSGWRPVAHNPQVFLEVLELVGREIDIGVVHEHPNVELA
jgi:hypothetical protein